jgi:hypothetical protein
MLLALVAAFMIFPGYMVKSTVNTVGPTAMGVDVHLEKAIFRMARGKMTLRGLFIGNPEGFNTKSLCEVDMISVRIDPRSLLTDTVIIESVYVQKPVFTYQKSLMKSNLSVLIKNLEGKEKQKEKKDKKGRKVIIRRLIVKDPMLKLSVKGIPAGAPIPLPDIEMTDIGKDKGGTSVVDVLGRVFGAVLKLATKAALSPVKIVGATGSAAVGTVKGVGKGVVGAAKFLTGTGGKKEDEQQTAP